MQFLNLYNSVNINVDHLLELKWTNHKYQISAYQNIENINWSQENVKICKQIKLFAVHALAPCVLNVNQMSMKLCESGRGFSDSRLLVPHVGNYMQKGVVHDKGAQHLSYCLVNTGHCL